MNSQNPPESLQASALTFLLHISGLSRPLYSHTKGHTLTSAGKCTPKYMYLCALCPCVLYRYLHSLSHCHPCPLSRTCPQMTTDSLCWHRHSQSNLQYLTLEPPPSWGHCCPVLRRNMNSQVTSHYGPCGHLHSCAHCFVLVLHIALLHAHCAPLLSACPCTHRPSALLWTQQGPVLTCPLPLSVHLQAPSLT